MCPSKKVGFQPISKSVTVSGPNGSGWVCVPAGVVLMPLAFRPVATKA